MRILLSFLVAVLAVCCTNSDTTSATDSSGETIHPNVKDTVVTGKEPVALAGCYQLVMKRDTSTIKISIEDSTVTGTIKYNLFEKDKNTGTIKGYLRDSAIYADYTFQSEGITSVREVVFKIKGPDLVEGYGNVTEKNNKVVFVDPDNLQFKQAAPFVKINCP